MTAARTDHDAEAVELLARRIVAHRFTRTSMWDEPFPSWDRATADHDDDAWREAWRSEARDLLDALLDAGYYIIPPFRRTPWDTGPEVSDGLEVYKRDLDGRTYWRLAYDNGAVTVELPDVPVESVWVNGQHYAPAPEPEYRPFVVRDGIGAPEVGS